MLHRTTDHENVICHWGEIVLVLPHNRKAKAMPKCIDCGKDTRNKYFVCDSCLDKRSERNLARHQAFERDEAAKRKPELA